METIDLNLLQAFVAVREAMSFSAAADRLGVPRSTVSRAVTALEAALGMRLFHRTTRSVSVSTAGEAFYERIAPRLADLQAALQDLPERTEAPSGLLRVTTTIDLGTAVLAETATRFVTRYPQVQVEVHLSNAPIDLVREGFDLALRIASKGLLRDSTLLAQRVGEVALNLYAAPSYLARNGTPRGQGDLPAHEWVVYRGAPSLRLDGRGKASALKKPRINCDDMGFMRETLKSGAGIGALPSFLADADVAAGTLERVLPRWRAQTGTVYLVRPAGRQVPRKIAAFTDLLKEMLRQRPLSVAG